MTHRTMVRDETKVVANLTPGRHGYVNMLTWTGRGKVAPIAWAIAASPAVHLATVAQLPYGVDEITLAGGMLGHAITMRR